MGGSSAGSDVFFSGALLTICLLVLLLLRYYLPLRTTPMYVLVPVFLAISLPASIVLLVPIDLASTAGTDTGGNRGIWLPHRAMLVSWRITYWLTFALTWVILPLLGEYCDAGYRDPKDRFLYALRTNGRYQLITLGSGVVGAIYFIFQNGFDFETMKALVMALAYSWGLVLAIYLMGHGLVALPRSLYRNASISNRLRRLQSQAPNIHEKLTEALDKLDQYESQVVQLKLRKNGITRAFQEWIDELAESSSLPEARGSSISSTSRASTSTVPPVITERYLADLTRKLKRARHAKMRFSDSWDHLVRNAIDTQAILDSAASKRLEFQVSPFAAPAPTFYSRITVLTPYTRYLLHTHVIPLLYYVTSAVFALASVSIIWSEIVKSLDEAKLSIVGLTVVHHPESNRGKIGFAGQFIAGVWLSYMCACAFFSLTEVKIWGNRALVRRGTYLESATWYALQVAKLTVPLSFNFTTFVDPKIYKASSFYLFLGRLIDLTPLGSGFSSFFPIFVLVPVLATSFNLYGKIKNICGFGDLLEDEDDTGDGASVYGAGSWREGRALIDREIHGASGNTLGLAQRGGATSSPPNGGYRDNPPASNGTAGASRRPQARRSVVEDEEDGNFLSDFGTRVKNTFPWFDETEFRRPKWMGGRDGDEGTENSGAAATGTQRREGLARWFGGGPSEGRVRL
ncbi:uncharacterized protein BDZ99DRAFT_564625 [Mytilinidion resinicola]|uniref:Uncharacterized protein n=1 Tax=Mytilinidion resinicola TaxID=574789 RepID=A0A6A6Z6Q8_9PEZI|nr:uncharacterized protein BDZ99DRAFT_564625 [Mytilinidion resinicola]KAF2816781.1 hypothetical protein BDZ99DRAFT_564625 [Mytilinidion resinicola]